MTHIPNLPKNNIATLKIVNFETQIQAARKRKNASGVLLLFPFSLFFFCCSNGAQLECELTIGEKTRGNECGAEKRDSGALGCVERRRERVKKKGAEQVMMSMTAIATSFSSPLPLALLFPSSTSPVFQMFLQCKSSSTLFKFFPKL
jgi:hypothetical protein